MKKSILVILSCILCVILFQAFSVDKKPAYKNLQILPQDISEHELDSVMRHFSRSLGVKCNFCHVRNEEAKTMDFAIDDKPEKNVARKMMRMAIDINKNYFAAMGMDAHMDKEQMEHMDSAHMTGLDKMDKKDMKKDKKAIKNKDKKSVDKGKGNDQMKHDMGMQEGDRMGMSESRYMLMAINCYTCHRGKEHPDSKLPPPPPRQEGPPSPPNQNPVENK